MVERFGTIRRDAIQRQRPVNITHRVVCCGRARHDVQACRHAGTHHGAESRAETWCQHCWHGRGANQNWYGVADRLPFMACPGAPKVAKSKLRFPLATGVIVLVVRRYLGYIETIGGSFSHCKVPVVDPGNCPGFTVSPEGCSPNSRPAISPRRRGPRLARRSSRVHRPFPAGLVDSLLA